ncbi:MAG TPA: hypothetical protein VF771_14770 [Longimicrobiaceae bacterium]
MRLRSLALLAAACALSACRDQPYFVREQPLNGAWDSDVSSREEITAGGLRVTHTYLHLELADGTFRQELRASDDRGAWIEELATGIWQAYGGSVLFVTDHRYARDGGPMLADPQPAPVAPERVDYRFTLRGDELSLVVICGMGAECVGYHYHRASPGS